MLYIFLKGADRFDLQSFSIHTNAGKAFLFKLFEKFIVGAFLA